MQKLTTTKQELFDWAEKNLLEYERHAIFHLDFGGPSPVNEDVRLQSWTELKKDDLRHMEVFDKLPSRLNNLFRWAISGTTDVYELAQAYKNISNIDFQTLKSTHTILKMYRYHYSDYEYLAESNLNLRLFLDLLRHIANNHDRLYVLQVRTIRQQIVMLAYKGYPEYFVGSREFKRLVEAAK